jgi:hypothetical protein
MRTKIGVVAMTVALGALGGRSAVHAQQCVRALGTCEAPWFSSMSFSAQFTLTGGVGTCNNSQAPCDYVCQFSSTDSCGSIQLGSCPEGGENTYSCGSGSGNVAWGADLGSPGFLASTSPSLNGQGMRSISVSIEAVLAVPLWASLNGSASAAPWTIYAGGDVIENPSHGYGATRWFRAGETVVLVGTAVGATFLQWGGSPCSDVDANGVCDTYENIARNFGDFDASGDVGASDLATMLSAWGSSGGSDGVIDLDNDGIVGASDLGILLSRWGLGA